LAQSAAFVGVVCVFITGDLWLYVEGLIFASLGMVLIAPTRRTSSAGSGGSKRKAPLSPCSML
jgi:hypothetical protein